MFKKPSTDIWRCGIAPMPIQAFLAADVKVTHITWLPQTPAFCFDADPFALWHQESLYVFVEHYDYRYKHGTIRCHVYRKDLTHSHTLPVLRELWHLSYPFMIEDGTDIYMLPEACRSGQLTLYKAEQFPDHFVPCAVLLDKPAVDASLIKYQERWWLFYSVKDGTENSALHLAYAQHIQGPYTRHPLTPVYTYPEAARCGGTPFIEHDLVHIPMQDCTQTYGGALNILRVDTLTTTGFSASISTRITPAQFGADDTDGTHSLSQAGLVSVFDVKRIDRSWGRLWVNLQRRFNRLFKLG